MLPASTRDVIDHPMNSCITCDFTTFAKYVIVPLCNCLNAALCAYCARNRYTAVISRLISKKSDSAPTFFLDKCPMQRLENQVILNFLPSWKSCIFLAPIAPFDFKPTIIAGASTYFSELTRIPPYFFIIWNQQTKIIISF